MFKAYRDAYPYLEARIGYYCSYCEIPRPEGPDIEHILPKSKHPGKEKKWGNFLLACKYCNSTKSSRKLHKPYYLWPDTDNTFRAYVYRKDMPPRENPTLPASQQRFALNTLRLVGLDKLPKAPTKSAQKVKKDPRWQRRIEAWEMAESSREAWLAYPVPEMRDQIVKTALGFGFWSVWMTVFATIPDVRKALTEAFPGTANNCFDAAQNPICRPGRKV